MNEATFPQETEGGVEVQPVPPTANQIAIKVDGQVQQAWLKTLNDLQRNEAIEAATWYARQRVRPFRDNGQWHEELCTQLRAMSSEEQQAYLADYQYRSGEIIRKAAAKYPDPQRPEQEPSESQEAYQKKLDGWEKKLEETQLKRQKLEDKLYEDVKADSLKLTAEARLEQLLEAYYAQRYNDIFGTRVTSEFLWRALRQADNKRTLFFISLEEVLDLPDQERARLIQAYNQLDTVTSEQVPISPVDS